MKTITKRLLIVLVVILIMFVVASLFTDGKQDKREKIISHGKSIIQESLDGEYDFSFDGSISQESCNSCVRISSSTEDMITFVIEADMGRVAGGIGGVAYRIASTTAKMYESRDDDNSKDPRDSGDFGHNGWCKTTITFPDNRTLFYSVLDEGPGGYLEMPACSSFEGAGGGAYSNGAIHQKI